MFSVLFLPLLGLETQAEHKENVINSFIPLLRFSDISSGGTYAIDAVRFSS